MAQAETVRKEPNLKRYTDEEKMDMILGAVTLLKEGEKAEADALIGEVELHWNACKILKVTMGIDRIIANDANLSEAVDHFGMEWLERSIV